MKNRGNETGRNPAEFSQKIPGWLVTTSNPSTFTAIDSANPKGIRKRTSPFLENAIILILSAIKMLPKLSTKKFTIASYCHLDDHPKS
jgi:hypothetical protein